VRIVESNKAYEKAQHTAIYAVSIAWTFYGHTKGHAVAFSVVI